jgi:hypothetical protein
MEIWLSWVIVSTLFVCTVTLVWVAARFRFGRKWFRAAVRILSGLLSLPLALVFLAGLSMQGCTSHTALIGSPDHKHVARVIVAEGWNEPDLGTVILRRSWTPAWTVIFHGDSFVGKPGESIRPKVRWSDDSHLVIEPDQLDGGEVRMCRGNAGGITITCKMQ